MLRKTELATSRHFTVRGGQHAAKYQASHTRVDIASGIPGGDISGVPVETPRITL